MELVIPLWVLAMVAGLCWPRWAVALATAATVIASVIIVAIQRPASGPFVWCLELAAFTITPWLLAVQRTRYRRRLKRLQAKEASRLTHLQERTRLLAQLQQQNQQQEATVIQITDLYHVTKETSKALHVAELFAQLAQIVPRLLTVRALRLIDAVSSPESPAALRASPVPDGRLMPATAQGLEAWERQMLTRAATTRQAVITPAGELGGASPRGVAQVAWAPIWGDQALTGVLIAEDLPTEQLDTLSIIANQVSLQLSRVHLYQTIEAMAVTDSLTGLSLRRHFQDLATEEIRRSARHGLPCALLMVDLDWFKSTNDTYGHLVGDAVLRETAARIRQNLREIDLMARYGGEEFVFLLVETAPEQAVAIAERLRQVLDVTPIRAYDEAVTQTISVGVACFPEDADGLERLLERADEALYQAKRAGRNCIKRWVKPHEQGRRPEVARR